MTTMTEQDEDRLRERLHTIGDAISTCHDEGRADLLAPRRSHRYGVTAAVAAAAVLVLVGVAVLVTRGGDEATTTRVADGSGVLDGLRVTPPPERAFVSTDRGLVVVTNSDDAHGWQPSVYSPGPDGVYRWYVGTETPGLRPGPAWLDGDIIHTVGYVCPADEMDLTKDQSWGPCGSHPLVALSFSLRTMEWSEAVEIRDDGLPLSPTEAAGNGRFLIAAVTDEPGRASAVPHGLARVDVTDGSVTRLQGTVANPQICPSGDSFVIGTRFGGYAQGPGDPLESKSDPSPSSVGVIEGDRVEMLPVYVQVSTGAGGLASANGCAENGAILQPDLPSSVEPLPLVAVADAGGTSVSIRQIPSLPAGWGSAGSVSYSGDSTGSGTALVALGIALGSEDDETTTVGVWNPSTETWTRLAKPVPPIPAVVVDRQGNIFTVDMSGDAPDGPWHLRGPLE
jgi:hypothetical protein